MCRPRFEPGAAQYKADALHLVPVVSASQLVKHRVVRVVDHSEDGGNQRSSKLR